MLTLTKHFFFIIADRPIGGEGLLPNMSHWGGLGILILPPLGFIVYSHFWLKYSLQNEEGVFSKDEKLFSSLENAFGGGFAKITISAPLLALLPLGILAWGPIAIIIGFCSKEGRANWTNYKESRIMAISIILATIIISAALPVSQPNGPDEWGEPFAKENPDAALWPSSEVYLWLSHEPEIMVISHTTTRIPGVAHSYLAEELTAKIIEITGADDKRLKMAVERMSQETILAGAFDPERFELVEIPSEGEHTYKSEERGIEESLVASRQYVTYDSLMPGTEVLEVLTVHMSEMGGIVHTLTIVKLAFSIGDIWSEAVVMQWIEHLELQ
jgi:hypothetical protein